MTSLSLLAGRTVEGKEIDCLLINDAPALVGPKYQMVRRSKLFDTLKLLKKIDFGKKISR